MPTVNKARTPLFRLVVDLLSALDLHELICLSL